MNKTFEVQVKATLEVTTVLTIHASSAEEAEDAANEQVQAGEVEWDLPKTPDDHEITAIDEIDFDPLGGDGPDD